MDGRPAEIAGKEGRDQSGWHPKGQPEVQERRKKLPEVLATLLTPDVVRWHHVRLMFQDEARLGWLVRIRRYWSPAPLYPKVDNRYERESHSDYGAVSR